GSKRNWHSVANALSNELNRPVYALDLRNHGESPHAKPMTYPQMALDVTHFIQKHNLERISLVGHSMGGKVAMTTVLGRYLPPSTIANLVVADIAPIKGKVSRASVSYFEAMKKIESMKLKTKKEARNVLAEWEKASPRTQAFLLTNLIVPSDPSSLQEYAKFGIPLDILSEAVPDIGIFPYEPGEVEPWTGRTLFVKGGKSKFLNEDAIGVARKLFPSMELEVLDAGHYGELALQCNRYVRPTSPNTLLFLPLLRLSFHSSAR
ncbi:alpha/beta-hydrolase, partial [Dendrothele bispora CBS 962.96]